MQSINEESMSSETMSIDGTKPNMVNERNKITKAPWRALFYFTTRSNIPLLLLSTITSLASGLVSPATSRLTGAIVNDFTEYAKGSLSTSDFFDKTRLTVCYLVATAAFNWIVESLDFGFWIAFGELQAKNARDEVFSSLLDKETEWYDTQPNGISALLPELQTQIRQLQLGAAQPLGVFVAVLSTTILSLIQAFAISWRLAIVTLCTAPLIMGLALWAGRGVQANLVKQRARLTAAQKVSSNAFSAIETVKCFNGQPFETEKYASAIQQAAFWYHRVTHAHALKMALITLLSVSMFVQGFYYGGVLVRSGELSVGSVITTFLSAVGAFFSVTAILPQMIVLEKGRAAGAALRAILEDKNGADRTLKAKDSFAPKVCRGDIEFRNVTFAYPTRPTQPALSNIDISIPARQTVFLIGKSGSGKSTLGQLLVRHYDISQGKILLDGNPIKTLDKHWLRKNVALVEQSSVLFQTSLFRNIAFGRIDYKRMTRFEAQKAAQFALLQLMINDLPNGIETAVGRGGNTLSGGQRQRVALARARLRDSPVLILDETTSALDVVTRSLMMDAIRSWRRGRTTIIITHDVSQIRAEDYVFVLGDGKVVQRGFRKQLLDYPGGEFRAFVEHKERGSSSSSSVSDASSRSSSTTSTTTTTTAIISRSSSQSEFEKKPDTVLKTPIRAFVTQVAQGGAIQMAIQQKRRLSTCSSRLTIPLEAPGPTVAALTARNRISTMPPSMESSGFFSAPSDAEDTKLEAVIHRTGALAVESRSGLQQSNRKRIYSNKISPTRDSRHARKRSDSEPCLSVPPKSLYQIMSTLWPMLNHTQRLALVAGFWAATIHALSSPVTSYVLARLIETYSAPGGEPRQALVYSMVMLGLAISDAISTYLYRMLLEYCGQCWVDGLRAEAMKRVLEQPRTFFDADENNVAHLTDSLDRHAEEMRALLGRFCGLAYIVIVMSGVSVLWALVAQWKLTLLTLAMGPYLYLITKAFAAVSTKWENACDDAAEVTSVRFFETFSNLSTVRSLTLEKNFLKKYCKASKATLRVGYERSVLCGLFYGLSTSAGNFITALMFLVGVVLVKNGSASTRSVIQVFAQLTFAVTNLSAMLDSIPQISSSKNSADRLLRLAQLSPDSHEQSGTRLVSAVKDIVFDDLSFSYPSNKTQTTLAHLTLHLEQGSCTAIAGSSGSGKSTITNLLLGLYSPSEKQKHGILTISGSPISDLCIKSIRSRIAIVPQTSVIFAGTILENITYGLDPISSNHATLSGAQFAACQAEIHDFITSLPESYDTLIGQGGTGLSGGQMQRIALARALVRDPDVLVLDEATSALDSPAAASIRRALMVLRRTRERPLTIVVVTHDRQMMAFADRVVVLDQGQIVEDGKFEELESLRGGVLARMLDGEIEVGD